jgi:proteasome assembly chaperone (PAC2) family protein
MMESIHWTADAPELEQPTLILAFEGWNDAGDAASTAARHIRDRFGGEVFATIDAEEFYDFTTTRPMIRLDGQDRHIDWPENSFAAVRAGEGESARDLIVMVGTEPQLRWRSYCDQIVAMAEQYEIDMVVSLGALIADVVHSRPATVYSAANDLSLIERLDLEPSSYEGPTGIVGVAHEALRSVGLGSISLWATVPSYVPHATSPKAALALVNRVAQLLDLAVPSTALEIGAAAYERQINELVAEDPDTEAYVTQLEAEYDNTMRPESGAALIEELEQFLRDRGE